MVVYFDSKSNRKLATQSLFEADSYDVCNASPSHVKESRIMSIEACVCMESAVENADFILCSPLASVDLTAEQERQEDIIRQEDEDDRGCRHGSSPTSILRKNYKPRIKTKKVKWKDQFFNKEILDDFWSGNCGDIFDRDFKLVEVLGDQEINATSPLKINYTPQTKTIDPIMTFRNKKLSTLDNLGGVDAGQIEKPGGNQLFASKNLPFKNQNKEVKIPQSRGMRGPLSTYQVQSQPQLTQPPLHSVGVNHQQQNIKKSSSKRKGRTPQHLVTSSLYRSSEKLGLSYGDNEVRFKDDNPRKLLYDQKLRRSRKPIGNATSHKSNRAIDQQEPHYNFSKDPPGKHASGIHYTPQTKLAKEPPPETREEYYGLGRDNHEQKLLRQEIDAARYSNATNSDQKKKGLTTSEREAAKGKTASKNVDYPLMSERDFDIVKHIQNHSLTTFEGESGQKSFSQVDLPKHTEKRFAEIVWKSKESFPKKKKGIFGWRKQNKIESGRKQLSQMPCYDTKLDFGKDDGEQTYHPPKRSSDLATVDTQTNYDIHNPYNFDNEPLQSRMDEESINSRNNEYDPYLSEQHWQQILKYDL